MRIALTAAFLLALPLPTLAYQEHGGQADDRLVREYSRFAGSKSNAESLVHGLRNDTQVKLTSNGRTTTFTPPTSKMGYGNVDIALSLAKASLAEEGIRNPTPEQIRAALAGGTVTTKSGQRVALPGVLKQRASGMGWGKVAQANGFKLGEVMRDKGHGHGHKHGDGKHDRKHGDRKDHKHSNGNHDRKHSDKHDRKHADWKHDRKHSDGKHDRDHAGWKHDRKHSDWKHDRKHHADGKRDHHRGDWKQDRHHADWKHDRGDYHRARYDRPERPHKIDRPERFERPERPERPERHHRR